MALLSTNFRTGAPQALLSLPNSSSGRDSRSSRSRSASLLCTLLTPSTQCCSFSGRSVSAAGPGGFSGCFSLESSHLARRSAPITPSQPHSAGVVISSMAANCSSEVEPLGGEVGAPVRAAGGFIASALTAAAGLLGSARSSGRGGDIQEGGGGRAAGGEEAGAVKELFRLGCALFTPGVGATAASSGGHWWSPFVPGMHDVFAGVVTMGAALAFLQVFNELAKRNVLDKKLNRKLVHVGVGLIFMLFWPLYTTASIAPYVAALAPGLNAIRLLFIGLGYLNDDAIVKSMTREGDRRELVKGPFYYGVAMVITTVAFWRTSPVGIVALVTLCAGDGFADIIGRNFGKTKLPYNRDKSVAGSAGSVVTSFLISMLYLWYFSAFGLLTIVPRTVLGVALISFATALVESLPISTRLDDNFTVPFTAAVLGIFLFPV